MSKKAQAFGQDLSSFVFWFVRFGVTSSGCRPVRIWGVAPVAGKLARRPATNADRRKGRGLKGLMRRPRAPVKCGPFAWRVEVVEGFGRALKQANPPCHQFPLDSDTDPMMRSPCQAADEAPPPSYQSCLEPSSCMC